MKKIISIIMVALVGIAIIPKTLINERHIVLESTTSVYTKEEVDNLLSTIRTNITNNTNEITNIKSELTTLQNSLKDYALKTSLNTTNSNIDGLNTVVTSNSSKITSLETLYSGGNATASQILKGKTAIVGSKQVTGTMANKAGTTTVATTVTESGDNALITIPANGYYSTSSKISVPIETIEQEFSPRVFLRREGSIKFTSELNQTFTNNEGVDAYYAIFVNLPQGNVTGSLTITITGKQYEYNGTADYLHLGSLIKVKSGESFKMQVKSSNYTNATYMFDIYAAS